MTEGKDLLTSIATTIKDYSGFATAKPLPEHIDKWLSQFDGAVQLPLLREMNHVLSKTYYSFDKVNRFLTHLLTAEKLVGKDHCAFWKSMHFLDIQKGGNSQRDLLAIFNGILKSSCGIGVTDCGKTPAAFVYVDDAIFSGNRVRRDIEEWLSSAAPNESKVHVVAIAVHSGGQHYANTRIQEHAKKIGKKVSITWWHAIELEDRKTSTNASDVLRSVRIPDVAAVQAYVAAMTHKQVLRTPGNLGTKSLFSSEDGRNLLEQEFLKSGVNIRSICSYLSATQRPLGHMTLETLGFGSLIVTFRNCPNNAPLALWVGDPWYPLFPRTTNSQTESRRMIERLLKGTFT